MVLKAVALPSHALAMSGHDLSSGSHSSICGQLTTRQGGTDRVCGMIEETLGCQPSTIHSWSMLWSMLEGGAQILWLIPSLRRSMHSPNSSCSALNA